MSRLVNESIKEKLVSVSTTDNREALLFLHEQVFPSVKSYVMNASGNSQDAEDIFQDGLFILLKMAKQKKLPAEFHPEAYLFTICKNRWKKSLMKTGNKTQITDELNNIPDNENHISRLIESEKKAALANAMSQLCTDCRQLLLYYYYEKKRMKEIAQLMNYSGEAVAKNKKSKCMKKLRGILFSSTSKKDFFLD